MSVRGENLASSQPAAALPASAAVVPYERRLDADPRWALSEGSRHFDETSAVFQALHKIARRLDGLGVPYAVVGAIALFRHGLRRFTEDVDLLVTRDGLKRVHDELEGLGYLPPHRYSKNLRDTDLGVRIEFLTTGDYPGDGKPKPVAFPDPRDVVLQAEGIRYVNLPTLVQLKLASGMTSPSRLKDLADVLELIKLLGLPEEFAGQLDPYVRDKFRELWGQAVERFGLLWPAGRLATPAATLEELARALPDDSATLAAMAAEGVTLAAPVQPGDRHARLVTSDVQVARKYDMVRESELWAPDETPRGS